MPALKSALLVFLISILFLIPASIVKSPSQEAVDTIDNNESKNLESVIETEQTRTSTESRANFEIYVTSPVSMPKVEDSWNQSDWSGGSGQDIWSDTDKFDYSKNINYSTPDSQLELGPGALVEAWKQHDNGPDGRYRHTMTWAESRKVFYVFGGRGGGWSVHNELWEYNPATDKWTQRGQSGAPAARNGHTAVWDSVHNLLYIYGGNDGNQDNRFNDLWAYNPSSNSWSQKAFAFDDKCYAAGAFDPNTQQIIIYGGYAGSFNNPSHEVWTYNTSINTWYMKHNYTRRFYHDGAYSAKTKSVFFYGGAERWQGGGGGGTYTFVNQLNEYFPQTDTWVNHSGTGNRVRPMLAYNTKDQNLIMHGGGDPGDKKDLWVYNIDAQTWSQRILSPMNDRDYSDGDWDSINNQFVTYGGQAGWDRFRDVWAYYPSIQGYAGTGDLVSSVFSPGTKFNPVSVSFNLSKPILPEFGDYPVKIQIAGATTTATEATLFVGPGYYSTTYFQSENGVATPDELNGIKYLAYKVNLSTEHPLYTPELNWLRIDYYTYPAEYTYVSSVYPVGPDKNLPLRYVNWTSKKPTGTDIEIYFKQAVNTAALAAADWEKVTAGQKEFGFKGGMYFQYRVILKTTEPGFSPELSTIRFVFNQVPSKPDLIMPLNEEWVGTSTPKFTWKFNDPDTTDYQSAFQLHIAVEKTFTYLAYTSGEIEMENNSYAIDLTLEEGEYYWKVMLRDNYGSWSTWSDTNYLIVDTGKPSQPKIESYSHPLEHLYYSNSRVDLHWNEPNDPSGIAGYSYILDESPYADPPENITMTTQEFNLKYGTEDFQGLVTYDNVPDGTWYFHLIASDTLGTWSDKVTRTIKIDTKTPTIVDHTPANATSGQNIQFKFEFDDALSGVDITTISWKYPSDVDYQFDELAEGTDGNFTLQHQVELTTDLYIEYYVEVSDFAEKPNTLRYPKSATKKINLRDTQPPVIIETTGSKTHNQFANLEIMVKATDNVGVSEAIIYFNDQSLGRTMTRTTGNTFVLKIDRVELPDLSGYTGNNSILYKIRVWDYQNNTDLAPDSGNYQITLEEIEQKDDDEKKESSDQGLSTSFLMYLIAMIIIVVIVALVLFMFIRKQKEAMDEDRHKLRMAIADVTEAASAGGLPYSTPPTGMGAGTGAPGEAPAIDIQVQSTDMPSLEPQQQPVGYLPEAPLYTDESIAQPQEDQTFDQSGLMTGQKPQPQPQPATGATSPTPAPATSDIPQVPPPVTPAGKEKAKVNLDNGMAVSLPEDESS